MKVLSGLRPDYSLTQYGTILGEEVNKGKRRAVWWISYDDESGKRRSKKGFTDKRATEDLALELEQAVRRKKAGLTDAVVERRAVAAKMPIEQSLVEFEKSISKNSPKHVELTMSRLRRLVGDAEFKTLEDVDVDAVVTVLDEMLEAEEIGHKTYNHYAAAASQFGAWLVPKKLAVNPFAEIQRLNTEVDVRHPRRALTEEEFRQLLKSARESNVSIQCYDGEQRARIYTISYMTGLRRKEIASPTPSSFDLKSTPATVTVEAACSKHRRQDVLPLHPELGALLIDWLKGLGRKEFLFPKLAKRRAWLMVKKDLARVGIPYVTDEGIADFHAAGRHSHITGLIKGGVKLAEAKELARHSDVRMTMKYTHIGLEDQAQAIKKLQWNRDSNERSNSKDDGSWQRYGSGSRHTNGHSVSSTGNGGDGAQEKTSPVKHDINSSSDKTCRCQSSTGTRHASAEDTGLEPATGCPAPAFQAGR